MLRSLLLNHHRIVAVTGAERALFLQGQLTQDVDRIGLDATMMAGWSDAKGRLLYAGHLFRTRVGTDDALALLAPAEIAEGLLKRLRMYVLRAKVQVTLLDVPIAGVFGRPPDPAGSEAVRLYGQDGRYLLVGPAAITACGQLPGVPPGEWQLADVRAGLPAIVAATTSEFVAQMVNLDLLDGISFTKGCYTGQEIVARMKYLGRVKRRMLRFATTGDPPAPGAALYAARGTVGQVVISAPAEAGSEFLAVVVLDDLPGPLYVDAAQTQLALRLDLPYEIPQ